MDYLNAIAKHLPQGSLRPGATLQQIEAVEAKLGQPLPQEWRALYQQHDGDNDATGVLLGLFWLPLAEVLVHWQGWVDMEAEYGDEGRHYSLPPGAIQERYITRGWIPIAHDYGGNHLGIDLNPGPNGRVGQIINFGRDQEIKKVIAHDANDLFRFIAEQLAAGNCKLNDDGYLESPIDLLAPDIPIPLYHAAPTPQGPPEDWFTQLSPHWRKVIGDPKRWLKAKELHLMNKDLTDLEPLRWCRDLVGLFLARNPVADLSPLAGLTSLRTLNLINTEVRDLAPLAGLTQLRELTLSGTKVQDLSPICKLPQLQELYLNSTDLTSLPKLPDSLRVLGLPAGVRDWSGLPSGLKTLTVHGVEPSLEGLKGLRELSVRIRPGDDLGPLSKLSKLHRLSLMKGQNIKPDFLQGLTNLKELDLHECHLTDLDGLKGKIKFTTLTTYDSPIDNLDGLLECPNMRSVAGSFEQFDYLKERLPKGVDFSSIRGDMTEEQRDLWRNFNRA